MQPVTGKEARPNAGKRSLVIRIVVYTDDIIEEMLRTDILHIPVVTKQVTVMVVREIPQELVTEIRQEVILETQTGTVQVVHHIIITVSAAVDVDVIVFQTVESPHAAPAADLQIIAHLTVRAFAETSLYTYRLGYHGPHPPVGTD